MSQVLGLKWNAWVNPLDIRVQKFYSLTYPIFLNSFPSFIYIIYLTTEKLKEEKRKRNFHTLFIFFWLVCSNKMVKITLIRSCASLSLSGPFSSLIGSLSCMVVWLHELHSLYSLHMSDLFIYLFIHTFPYPLLEILHGIILF